MTKYRIRTFIEIELEIDSDQFTVPTLPVDYVEMAVDHADDQIDKLLSGYDFNYIAPSVVYDQAGNKIKT